jgi:hypothetical protein
MGESTSETTLGGPSFVDPLWGTTIAGTNGLTLFVGPQLVDPAFGTPLVGLTLGDPSSGILWINPLRTKKWTRLGTLQCGPIWGPTFGDEIRGIPVAGPHLGEHA